MPITPAQAACNARALQRFGAPVVLAGISVMAVFDEVYANARLGGAGMASVKPTLMLLTGSIPPRITDWFLYFEEPFDAINLHITLDSGNFKIVAHEPDGMGMSLLLLERIA